MKKPSIFSVLILTAIIFLASGPSPWECRRLIQPEYLERTAQEFPALFELRTYEGQEVFVPLPAGRALEALSGGTGAWRAAVRAQLLERQGRMAEAEQAWQDFGRQAAHPAEGVTCLAAFYNRHRQYRQEITLVERSVAALAGPPGSELTAADVWNRLLTLAGQAGFTPDESAALYRRRADFFKGQPQHQAYFEAWLENLLERRQWAAFEQGLAEYGTLYPDGADEVFRLQAERLVAENQVQQLPGLFLKQFHPLMDPDTVAFVFRSLETAGLWKPLVRDAENRLRRDPLDAGAVYLLCHCQIYRENLSAAAGILRDYRVLKNAGLAGGKPKAPWTQDQLAIMGVLSGRCNDYGEALRYFTSLYRDSGGKPKFAVTGLSGEVARAEALRAAYLVLVTGEDGIRQYSGESLRALCTLAGMDTEPGLLAGALSLLLNGEDLAGGFDRFEQNAAPYFVARRAEATLVELKPLLGVEEYVALKARLADVYRHCGQKELAWKVLEAAAGESADPDTQRGLLLGAASGALEASNEKAAENCYRRAVAIEGKGSEKPLSPAALAYWLSGAGSRPRAERWKALDELAGFLMARQRPLEVVALYRDLIAANPGDERLYEKLSGVLEAKAMLPEQEAHYRAAMAKFEGPGWFNRLARFYLRQKRTADFQELSGRIVGIFAGTDLEVYLREVLPDVGGMDKNAYNRFILEINQAALQRFPLNPNFLQRVLSLSRQWDPPRYQRLLASYCVISDEARDQYFAGLSARKLLEPLLQGEVAADDPLLTYLAAEARIWRCRFEEATPLYRRLADMYPGDERVATRCMELLRSEGAWNPERYGEAAALVETLGRRLGRESEFLITAGDCLAMGGDLDAASRRWREVLDLYPDDPAKWLDVATVFWDYYLFGESRRILEEIRRRKDDPALYPFEMAALLEEEDQMGPAMVEYLKLATTWDENSWQAKERLNRLFQKEKHRDLFAQVVATQLAREKAPVEYLSGLREFMSNYGHTEEFSIRDWVLTLLDRQRGPEIIQAALNQFGDLIGPEEEIRAYRSLVELSAPGTARLEAQFALIDRLWNHNKPEEAARMIAETVNANPVNLGVIRRSVQALAYQDRLDPAIAVLQQALPRAVDPYRREFTLRLVGLLGQARRFPEAGALVEGWLARSPDDWEMLQLQWRVMSDSGNHTGVVQSGKAMLERLPTLFKDPDRLREKRVEVHQQIIAAALAMGDRSLAVDHYLELLKIVPEERWVLESAFVVARQGNLVDRIVQYCQKTAAASPSDYRWPLLLARLSMLREDPAAASTFYAQCLKIVPQRTDLAAESARPLEIRGDWAGLQKLGLELAHLRYNDPTWLRLAATAAWRQGKDNEAKELARRFAEAFSPTPPEQSLAMFDLYAEWHRENWAMDTADQLLSAGPVSQELLYQLRDRRLLVIAARAGRLPETLGRLADLYVKASTGSITTYYLETILEIIREDLPEVFQGGLSAETSQAISRILRERLLEQVSGDPADTARDRLVSVAEKGEMKDLLVDLYQGRLARWSSTSLPWNMDSYLSARAMWPEMTTLNKGILDTQALESYQAARLYEELGWLYMLQNDTARELENLRSGYRKDPDYVSAELANRYYELLYRGSGLAELGLNLEGVTSHQGDYVDFLAQKKEYAKAAEAIRKLFRSEQPVWRETNLALLAAASGGALPMDASFRKVLSLGNIRSLLDAVPDESVQLLPPAWHHYAGRYGLELLAAGQSGKGAGLVTAVLERNRRRRADYDQLFEQALERGQTDLARRSLEWAEQLQPKDYQDVLARFRLAAAAGNTAEAGQAYGKLLDAIGKGSGDAAWWELDLVRQGKRLGVLESTTDKWVRLFLRHDVTGEYNPGADSFLAFAYALPAPARARFLETVATRHPKPAVVIGFYLDHGLVQADNFYPLAELAATRLGESDPAGREFRLTLAGKGWGATSAPAAASAPIRSFLRDESLRQGLLELTPGEWKNWFGWLRGTTPAAKPGTPEILKWAESMPGGRDRWAPLMVSLLAAWGLDKDEARLRLALMEANLRASLPGAEDEFLMGSWESTLGNPPGMLRHFRSALYQAEDRAAMSRRIIEFLLDHGQAGQVEPFLNTLEGLDRWGPEPAWLRLRWLLATNPAAYSAERLLTFLDRADVALNRRAQAVELVIQTGLKDKAWAAGLAAAIPPDKPGQNWSEIRRLLAIRLQSLQFGAEKAIPAAVADLEAHPEANRLLAWLVERAESANRADLLTRFLPEAFRTRALSERPLLPLLRASLAGHQEKTAASMVWKDCLSYGNLNNRTERNRLENLGRQFQETLGPEIKTPDDLEAIQRLLEHLNLKGGMQVLWENALSGDLPVPAKELLLGKLFELGAEMEQLRREERLSFQLDRELHY